jgi:peptidoglycan/LPS O-acetylase OafA/YrhL
LRGLAVLLVVLSHFTPDLAPGGFLGVDLFFVLSGFLITSLLVAEHRSSGSVRLGNFWVRRARRLFPALLVVLAAVAVVSAIRDDGPTQHQVGLDGLASLFYVANWRFIATGQSYVMQFVDGGPGPLRHMWSLAIEEQFYLLWPLVVLGLGTVLARRRGGLGRLPLGRALALLCGALAAASATWMVSLAVRGQDLDRLYYGTDTRLFMILMGSAIGALAVGRPQLSGLWRPAAIAVGSVAAVALLAATFVVRTDDSWLYRGGYVALGLVLCALLVGSAQAGPNPLAQLLSVRSLVGLGMISYGVYLWHWPIMVWVDADSTGVDGLALFVVRSLLTLAASLASYRFIETPIRRGDLSRLGPIRVAVAPAAVALLSIGLLVPVIVHPALPSAPEGPAPISLNPGAYASAPRCDTPADDGTLVAGRALQFQLIGNSLAGEVRECLTDILGDRGARHHTVNPPGFLLCEHAPDIEEQIREVRPDFAVLFLFAAYDDRCGEPWHATVDRLIDAWIAEGTHVFLVPTVPIPEGGRTDLQPGADLERDYYRQRAAADPAHITAVDGGRFLRDVDGTYLWRMPCAALDEPGCREDGTVPVRFVDGMHFCTSDAFAAQGCTRPEDAAGQRRAAASIAVDVIDQMRPSSDATA